MKSFGKYNAYSTMKKISRQSPAEYAAKNGLRQNIVENFFPSQEVIDYHATRDRCILLNPKTVGNVRTVMTTMLVVNPANYNNGFCMPLREVSGADYRFFSNSRRFGAAFAEKRRHIVKETLSHFVKWNNITYKVDIAPARTQNYVSTFNNKSIIVVENCCVFQSDDWNIVKKIETEVYKKKSSPQKSWFLKEKPDDVLLEDIFAQNVQRQGSDSLYRLVSRLSRNS